MKNFLKALLAFPIFLSTQAHAGSEPFVGEIMWVGYNSCPVNWVVANGQLLSMSDQTNFPLFALIGTQFGGDGKTNFAVPDLRGTTAIGAGQTQASNFLIGQSRQFTDCAQGQECPQTGTSSLTLLPCIAVYGNFPQRP